MRAFVKLHFANHFATLVALSALSGLVAFGSGCDRAPSASDAKEWTAADHDRIEERARVQAGAQAAPLPNKGKGGGPAKAEAETGGEDPAVALTWHNQCASCHGVGGHGDGPNGPMVRASDLTREEWQAKVTDAEIVAVIRNGKNQMPRFDLSDKVVAGLVARVRAVRGH